MVQVRCLSVHEIIWSEERLEPASRLVAVFSLSAAAFGTQAHGCSAVCPSIRLVLELVLFGRQPREQGL